MKHFKEQAHKDHAAKLGKFAGGGGLHHPDPMMGLPNMGGGGAHAHGGKAAAHKTPKSHKEPGPSAKELLSQPVPTAGGPAGPVGAIRPVSPAPAGLGAMMGAGGLKHGGRAHRADGGRTTKHHMTAGAESGVGRLEKIGRKP